MDALSWHLDQLNKEIAAVTSHAEIPKLAYQNANGPQQLATLKDIWQQSLKDRNLLVQCCSQGGRLSKLRLNSQVRAIRVLLGGVLLASVKVILAIYWQSAGEALGPCVLQNTSRSPDEATRSCAAARELTQLGLQGVQPFLPLVHKPIPLFYDGVDAHLRLLVIHGFPKLLLCGLSLLLQMLHLFLLSSLHINPATSLDTFILCRLFDLVRTSCLPMIKQVCLP